MVEGRYKDIGNIVGDFNKITFKTVLQYLQIIGSKHQD